MQPIPGYIITLTRAVERRPQVARIAASSSLLAWETVAAVDGKTLSADEIAAVYRLRLHRPYYPFSLNLSEIGCFLSHRKAWRKIIDSGASAGLIVEDDLELQQPQFNAAFAFAVNHLSPADYVKFQAYDFTEPHPVLAEDGPLALRQPQVAPLVATSQLVTREAAERLLAATETFDRPIDTFVQMTWLTRVPVKVVTPSCVSEISARLGGSTIAGRKSLWSRLNKELRRPLYRAKIVKKSHDAWRRAS